MKIIDNLPIWEHEDFVMRNPMVDCKAGNMVIGWMIVDKDTDVPESFQMSFTKDELTRYRKVFDNLVSLAVGAIVSTIINESVSYITNYVDTHDFEYINYEHIMDHVEFRSKLRFEVHTWFVHDNINILRSFEELIKEKLNEHEQSIRKS